MTHQSRKLTFDRMEPESVLAEKWLAMIPLRDRHEDLRPKRIIATVPRQAQIEKQSEFASECTPETEEEKRMVELYATGISVEAIATEMKRGYATTRKMIIRCHPTKTALK